MELALLSRRPSSRRTLGVLAKRELRVDLRQAHNDFHPESKEGKKGIRSWQVIKIQDRRPAHYIGLIKTPMISDGGVAYFGR